MEDAAPRASLVRRLRRLLPWIAGIAILVLILLRVRFDAFRASIGHGPHLTLAAVDLAISAAVFATDSISTWVGLIGAHMRRPLAKVIAVRGATYLLFLLNYAVGQGGFGYYLYRSGMSALRATGATLFLIGTNLATLMIVTTIAFAFYGVEARYATMWWTLLAGCAAFVVYLVVIVVAPAVVARREWLAPLFEGGIRGHAIAMAGRLPHVFMIVLGHWIAIRVWGIDVPLSVGVAIMPAVVIVSVVPISPGGLGTAQAALVYFFSDYAAGVSGDERSANVLAFAIAHFVYGFLASLLIGLVCTPFARRVTAEPPS